MRKFIKFIPVQVVFFLIIGIVLGYFLEFDPKLLTIFCCFSVFVFALIYFYLQRQFKYFYIYTFLVFWISFLIGISATTFQNSKSNKLFYANQNEFNTENPQTIIFTISKVLKPTKYYNRYESEISQIADKEAVGRLLVNIKLDSISLNVDDKLLAKTIFKEISSPKNPYEFNYRQYLENKQIFHQIYLEKNEILKIESKKKSIFGYAAIFRKEVNNSLKKYGFKNDELAVINALLLGQRQNISSSLMESYAGAGAIHILAVSGLHIGIITLILTFLFKPIENLKNGKIIASLCVVILLWMFAIIAGLSASVVRAVTMFTALTIGIYSNKPKNIYNSLIISIFFLLIFNPRYLFEVGFQLSYLAVFAIVWLQPKISNLIVIRNKILNKVWQLFTVSIAAQIGVLPLSLYYFHQFPGLFFLSNLLIIPMLGGILIGGIVVIFLALFDFLPQIFGDIYTYVIKGLNIIVSWISHQESFIIQNVSFSTSLLLATYLFILFFFKWIEKKNQMRFRLVLFSIIAIQLVFVTEKYKIDKSEKFIVFNKTKENIIGLQIGDKMEINTSIENYSALERPLISFQVGSGINDFEIFNKTNYLTEIKENSIFIVDSLGIYNIKSIDPTIIILQKSPKINLERLIKMHNPKTIIADASNYKSYIDRWKKTCIKMKTPFYDTSQNGAYILE